MNYTKRREIITLILSCLVLGLVVGLSSSFLSLILEFVEKVFFNFEESSARPYASMTDPVHRLISIFIGGLIVAFVWWRIRLKREALVTIPNAIKGKEMPVKSTILHVIAQIFYVGTGGSIGREVAPREAGTMFAQQWQKLMSRFSFFKLAPSDAELLLAAAAGAGFAGVYIAPLTGMFFCIEILLKKATVKTVTVSLSMSIIAMWVGSLFKGFTPYYAIPDLQFSLALTLPALLVGPLSGIMGIYFRKLFKWAEKNQTKDKGILWQLPLVALLTGIVALFFPQVMGNGRGAAQFAMNSANMSLLTSLLLIAILKAILTVLTIRSGASGGTLTPSIALGACLGAVIAILFNWTCFPISVAQVAVIGAAALLSVSQRAPLMASFMMIEVTHLNYTAIIPLGLAVLLAKLTEKLFENKNKKAL